MTHTQAPSANGSSHCRLVWGLRPSLFICINVLIVSYFSLAAIHISPPGPLQTKLERLIYPFMSMLCWNQHWHMFAPSIRDFNEYGVATIRFDDGSTRMQEFYRVELEGLLSRWEHAKMREFWLDHLCDTVGHARYFPGVSRYFVRALGAPEMMPEWVSLGANWARIPPMNERFTKFSELPQLSNHFVYFVYRVKPKDMLQ